MMNNFGAVVVGYVGAGAMALVAQVPDLSTFSSWIEKGALGLLGIAVIGQLYIIVISQKSQFDRMDGWEKQRHDDSAELNETLARMRENCAAQATKAK